jgi:membrane dipeptidase
LYGTPAFCRVPTGLEDVSKYVELFSALYASGKWSIEELKRLAGLNFLRVFKEVEKVRLLKVEGVEY